MHKRWKILSLVLLTTFLLTAHASATVIAPTEEETVVDPTTQVAYTVTGIVGVILALVLVGIARENSRVKGKLSDFKKFSAAAMQPDILRQIETLGGSSQNQREAALVISNLLQEKIDQKVDAVTQDITQRYTKIIDTKTQETTILEDKYKRTLNEKKQTEAIVRSVAEGVVVVNNKGEVLLMNPAAEKLLDTQKSEKIGRPLTEGAKEGQMFSIAKETEGGERNIELNSTADETKRILRSSSAVIEDENGKTVGMVTVLSDITKQKELEQLKSDFVASVSHELRNPIGAIQQSISVILDGTAGPTTEPQQRFLTNAQRNLKRLSSLIDDLLDLAKFEAKKMELKYESTSIQKLVDEVAETMETWAKNKEIKLVCEVAAGLPQINLDPNRIIQVIINLVGNAVKFTPQGGTITIAAKPADDGNAMELRVSDTGIGIEKKDLDRIFDKFQQVGKKHPTEISGTGLGLAIVKEIVLLHGGDIRAESEVGQGTTFIVTLPLNAQNNA